MRHYLSSFLNTFLTRLFSVSSPLKQSLFLGGLTTILYAMTLSRVPVMAHDAIYYFEYTISPTWFIHSHHILYGVLLQLWNGMWQWVMIDPFLKIAAFNAVSGGLVIGVWSYLLRVRLGISGKKTVLWALLAASTFGLWLNSTTVEVLVLAIAALGGCLILALKPELRNRDLWILGGLHALAMWLHTIFVLAGPVFCWIMWCQWRQRRVSWVGVMGYFFVGVGLVYVGYAIAVYFSVGSASFTDILTFITGMAKNESNWGGMRSGSWVAFLVKPAVGFSKAIIGGHFMFGFEWFASGMARVFPTKSLMDEQFLVHSIAAPFRYVLLIASLVAAGMWGYAILRAAGYLYRKKNTDYTSILAGMIVMFSVLFLVWEPHNYEYWITAVLIWCGVIVMVLSPKQIVCLAIVTFLVNGFGSILPNMSRENDVYQVMLNAEFESTSSDGRTFFQDDFLKMDHLRMMETDYQWRPYRGYFEYKKVR